MIKIVTFHRAHNYGAVLQNYALQSVLKNNDYLCETLDYRNMKIEDVYRLFTFTKSNSVVLGFKKFIYDVVNYRFVIKRRKKFNRFLEEKISMGASCDLEQAKKMGTQGNDIYITGSDQVWNSMIAGDVEQEIYTLSFVKRGKKIAYAASAGNSRFISSNMMKNISKLDHISVREKELECFLKKAIDKDIYRVCDPVFLLDKEFWLKELVPHRVVNKKYNLLYFLSAIDEDIMKVIEEFKNKENEMYYLMSWKKKLVGKAKCSYDAGPLEFLRMIYDAEMIITSSFHAVAFSIIFEKPFLVFAHPETGSRVIDLLEELGMSSRIVKGYDDYKEREKELAKIDYSGVKQKLDVLKGHSKEFLLNAVGKE